jgi:hypothetical protein
MTDDASHELLRRVLASPQTTRTEHRLRLMIDGVVESVHVSTVCRACRQLRLSSKKLCHYQARRDEVLARTFVARASSTTLRLGCICSSTRPRRTAASSGGGASRRSARPQSAQSATSAAASASTAGSASPLPRVLMCYQSNSLQSVVKGVVFSKIRNVTQATLNQPSNSSATPKLKQSQQAAFNAAATSTTSLQGHHRAHEIMNCSISAVSHSQAPRVSLQTEPWWVCRDGHRRTWWRQEGGAGRDQRLEHGLVGCSRVESLYCAQHDRTD